MDVNISPHIRVGAALADLFSNCAIGFLAFGWWREPTMDEDGTFTATATELFPLSSTECYKASGIMGR